METANPAESSAGEVILEPEESSAKDLESNWDDRSNCVAAICADRFVLITMRFDP
jgi:hypothetical protein